MFTFGFFVRLFVSGLLSVWILSLLTDIYDFLILTILFYIACVCTVISIFGMIWTF